jgi:predicted N-acyltransferase
VKLRIVERLDDIPAADWNTLAGDANPFLSHEFLSALEHHDCVGERYGWLPRHLAVYAADRLVGAVPLYLKDNSYGELVFDWAWADAYQRAGLRYYPKAVVAIPYTPATGPRLLLHPAADAEALTDLLTAGALELCRELGLSSLHWLFTDATDSARLQARGFMLRQGCSSTGRIQAIAISTISWTASPHRNARSSNANGGVWRNRASNCASYTATRRATRTGTRRMASMPRPSTGNPAWRP